MNSNSFCQKEKTSFGEKDKSPCQATLSLKLASSIRNKYGKPMSLPACDGWLSLDVSEYMIYTQQDPERHGPQPAPEGSGEGSSFTVS